MWALTIAQVTSSILAIFDQGAVFAPIGTSIFSAWHSISIEPGDT